MGVRQGVWENWEFDIETVYDNNVAHMLKESAALDGENSASEVSVGYAELEDHVYSLDKFFAFHELDENLAGQALLRKFAEHHSTSVLLAANTSGEPVPKFGSSMQTFCSEYNLNDLEVWAIAEGDQKYLSEKGLTFDPKDMPSKTITRSDERAIDGILENLGFTFTSQENGTNAEILKKIDADQILEDIDADLVTIAQSESSIAAKNINSDIVDISVEEAQLMYLQKKNRTISNVHR